MIVDPHFRAGKRGGGLTPSWDASHPRYASRVFPPQAGWWEDTTEDTLEVASPPPTAQAIPVLHLTAVRLGSFGAPITVTPSGFASFFCDPLPGPQVFVTIRGRILMQQNGQRRLFTSADGKLWQPATVVNRVYTGNGVSNSSNPVAAVKPGGTFSAESILVVDPGTRRVRILLTLQLNTGKEITGDLIIQYSPLECFLSLMDSWQDRMPLAGAPGCTGAAKGVEFLAAARKMFQPPPEKSGKLPDPSWKGAFDAFLSRFAGICPLTTFDSPEGKSIRRFENIEIGGVTVDMGHVLTGIEGSRRQKPDSSLPYIPSAAITEAFVTWAGDLGSALAQYAEVTASGGSADLRRLLQAKAGAADLFGDIDGINIGVLYDENKSLADNLRAYYYAKPFRRFRDFLTDLRDDNGSPLLRLARQNPPALDRARRLSISSKIAIFARALALKHLKSNALPQAQMVRLMGMLKEGPALGVSASKEMEMVVEYFFKFLESGLAKEASS
jgi:hypothetical protein